MRPGLDHQRSHCLSARFAECPYAQGAPGLALEAAPLPSVVASRRDHVRALSFSVYLGLLLLLVVGLYLASIYSAPVIADLEPPTPVVQGEVTLLPTVTPDVAKATATPAAVALRDAVATPGAVAQVFELTPQAADVGWWSSSTPALLHTGDSFLYAGGSTTESYVAIVRYDLSSVPRGAPVLGGTLQLSGLRGNAPADVAGVYWAFQLIAGNALPDPLNADFQTVFSAPAAVTLLPQLESAELGVGKVNEWLLDPAVRTWLEMQRMDGAAAVILRIVASTGKENAIFAWDSGHGSETSGNPPRLVLQVGAAPATPPPTPTRALLVATLTPVPQNVVTAVAQAATATVQMQAQGTAASIAYEVVTPTPLPQNLATVQANAVSLGLPPVIQHTPVPANAATVEADAAYATAVALTTGTFTPMPHEYVTPMIYYPPPPPENVATAAARVVYATAVALANPLMPTATPLPYNALPAVYAFATATPANAETAVAMIAARNADAVTTGTPTPTPWNLVIITRVPEPTPTEIPLVVPVAMLTLTPTPTPTATVSALQLADLRNKILFRSDRGGVEETWALDPATGQVTSLITNGDLHGLARELFLPNSPDGREVVLVQPDERRDLQIMVYSKEYNVTRQLTRNAGTLSYDPAWSPKGDLIAFVSAVSGGDEIYVVDPQGTTVTRLTYNTWEWDKHPSWSPDGSQIVFYSNREGGHKQIWIMNADGSNQRNLTNDASNNWDPVWVR